MIQTSSPLYEEGEEIYVETKLYRRMSPLRRGI